MPVPLLHPCVRSRGNVLLDMAPFAVSDPKISNRFQIRLVALSLSVQKLSALEPFLPLFKLTF